MVFQICRRHRWHFVLFFKMLHLFFFVWIHNHLHIKLHISVTAVQVFQKLHCGHLHGPCQRAKVFGVYCASYAVHDLHCTNSVFNCRLNFWGETGSLFLAHSCLALVKISSHICWSFIVLMTQWFLDRVLTYIQRLDSRIWMIQWTNSPVNSSRITKKEQKKTQKLHSLPLFEKRKSMFFVKENQLHD